LGKRVDYSGRSVIVVGPELKAAPMRSAEKDGARALQAVHLCAAGSEGILRDRQAIQELVEKEKPEVWDSWKEVIREHPVLLNRAHRLARLGIQAFEPVLIEGKATPASSTRLHGVQRRFDGDQMACMYPSRWKLNWKRAC